MSIPRFLTCLVYLCLIAVLTTATLSASPPEKAQKFAFMASCKGYDKNEFRTLPYAVAEIKEFKDMLVKDGFPENNIKLLHDDQERRYLPEKDKILRELKLLLNRVEQQDTLVVVLNGHGVQYDRGEYGYFCPLDAKAADPKSMVPMGGPGGVYDLLKSCNAKKKLLIVNACRNNPLSDFSFATNKVTLVDKYEDVPEGIAAIFSCAPGEKSYYFDEGPKRSLFLHHVMESWQGKYQKNGKPVTIEDVFYWTRRKTLADADVVYGRSQTPVIKREYSGEWVLGAGAILAKEFTNSIGMKLVRIPAGTFLMGSPASEENRQEDEGPQHEVEISQPFYLGAYEVTQAEYVKVMGENPSEFNGTTDNKAKGMNTQAFPVESVSWEDATEFCRKLSALPTEKAAGRVYTLPTEAQWEYACRGGSETYQVFHYGYLLSPKEANFWGDYPYPYVNAAKGPYIARPKSVGSYQPNAFGLYDMHGNVNEWCQDWYDEEFYGESDKKDPQSILKSSYRVIRGGGWYDYAWRCRSAYRFRSLPSFRYKDLGFRVAVSSVK